MHRPTADLSWLHRCLELRSRLLASERFRRWAIRLPLTRWIARRRARRLFDLCAGFVYSQVLLACVRLGLFERLCDGPRRTEELAEQLSLAPEAAGRLLRAAASLRLVERRGGDRYGLGPLGAAMVGNPGIAAMVEHHPLLYRDLLDPVALLRGELRQGDLARYWGYARGSAPSELGAERVQAYSDLMAASQTLIADEVLEAWPLTGHHLLLDVGGGDGTFAAAAAERSPGLRVIVFDLPAVAERARRRLAERGLSQRSEVVEGDFFRDPLPAGADVISLVRVVHDHDDGRALELLRAVHGALPPHGVLLLAEPFAGTAGAEPIADAYFGFYLLAMGSGRARTPAELSRLLRQAGFAEPRQVPTRMPLQTGVIVARRAAGE